MLAVGKINSVVGGGCIFWLFALPLWANPLLEAVDRGDLQAIRKLGRHQVNSFDVKRNTTALILAVKQAKPEVVKVLLQSGADVNLGNLEKMTPLHMAFKYHQQAMIKLLLEHGADFRRRDGMGNTPVFYLAEKQPRLRRDLLVNYHDQILHTRGKTNLRGRSLLHVKAAQSAMDFCAYLLELGFSPSQKDLEGNTPMHLAGSAEVFRLLYDHGGDTHIINGDGQSPADLARRRFKTVDLPPLGESAVPPPLRLTHLKPVGIYILEKLVQHSDPEYRVMPMYDYRFVAVMFHVYASDLNKQLQALMLQSEKRMFASMGYAVAPAAAGKPWRYVGRLQTGVLEFRGPQPLVALVFAVPRHINRVRLFPQDSWQTPAPLNRLPPPDEVITLVKGERVDGPGYAWLLKHVPSPRSSLQ